MELQELEKASKLHEEYIKVRNNISLWEHITSITIQRNTWSHSSESAIGETENFKNGTDIFNAVRKETLEKLHKRKDELLKSIEEI